VTIGYVVVGAFLGAADVGEYSAAFRIFSVLLIFPNLLWSSFYPLLSRAASSPTLWTRSFGVMMRYQWAAVWFFVAIAIWYPTEFLSLLYGERYMGSRGLLQVLLLSLSASFLSMALLRTLPALGRERQSLMILAVATAIHISAAAILTLDSGIIGAGISLLLTELFLFGATLLFWPDFRKGITNGASLFMGCGLLAFFGAEGLQIIIEMNRMTGFLLATTVYVVLVMRIGKLSLKQIAELESANSVQEVFKSA
jgi:O-antigen/teichoic acid export membrane protein